MPEWTYHFIKECDSTNQLAKKFPPYCTVHAAHQSAGKGRNGRIWQSFDGNLYMSVTLPLPENPATYTFLASLAVAQTLAFLSPRIKWPNDILVERKKIAGILLEIHNKQLIIGIGVNIMDCPKQDVLYPTTCLKNYNAETESKKLLDNILQNLKELLHLMQKRGFVPIREEWLNYATGLGQTIVIKQPDTQKTGIFDNIDEFGNLILKTNNEKTTVYAGDVFFNKENK